MFGSDDYICNDEEKWPTKKCGSELKVSKTAAELYEKLDKKRHVHWIEPFEQDVHSIVLNRLISVLNEQNLGLYRLFTK